MILSDCETCNDLLNNQAIADTIIGLILKRPGLPITIGVHGDWGAGKSSILEMIEAGFNKNFDKYAHWLPDPKLTTEFEIEDLEVQTLLAEEYTQRDFLCLKFNGWRFQGFEDAKIALLEGIVDELLNKRSVPEQAKQAIQNVFKRIDWLKVAKKAGGLALTTLTGIPLPEQIKDATDILKKLISSPSTVLTQENIEKTCSSCLDILKPAGEGTNVPKEVREFQKAFDELLDAAKIKHLVVLIDDLDRCLPDTAIETLEAIRLFLLTNKTAFIVAADEGMIEYAVRKHFPDLQESSSSQSYARNYLEKLIQVPFRIPSLGDTETRIYVTLLLIEAIVGQHSSAFKKLALSAKENLKKPWISGALDRESIRDIFQDQYDLIKDNILLSEQISPMLASGTSGNPRQVKRFLNSLLLRYGIAQARGFESDINMQVLAKIMLAERFYSSLFDKIASTSASSDEGRCLFVQKLEEHFLEGASTEDATADLTSQDAEMFQTFQNSEAISGWVKISPLLGKIDLRPYLFLVKDRKDYFGPLSALGHLSNVVDKLMGGKFAVASLGKESVKIQPTEATLLFEEIRQRTLGQNLSTTPPGVEGMKFLVRNFPALQNNLLDFLESLPAKKLGPWAAGLGVSISGANTQRYNNLLKKWNAEGSKELKATLASLLK
ncbi:MAG: NTPase KAP [Desulfovibrio sp.]|uniref:Qat anti-phage system ATPase QatA n=1 Tax=Desulfovibrio sp. TaxID=885 RepID=UPI0025BFC09B|nr:Qat anti-phage system ATPase QatA [Desulfovibrio sp.]MBS6830096.1 NTPase KAP [Desulfovibrio sp.]